MKKKVKIKYISDWSNGQSITTNGVLFTNSGLVESLEQVEPEEYGLDNDDVCINEMIEFDFNGTKKLYDIQEDGKITKEDLIEITTFLLKDVLDENLPKIKSKKVKL